MPHSEDIIEVFDNQLVRIFRSFQSELIIDPSLDGRLKLIGLDPQGDFKHLDALFVDIDLGLGDGDMEGVSQRKR